MGTTTNFHSLIKVYYILNKSNYITLQAGAHSSGGHSESKKKEKMMKRKRKPKKTPHVHSESRHHCSVVVPPCLFCFHCPMFVVIVLCSLSVSHICCCRPPFDIVVLLLPPSCVIAPALQCCHHDCCSHCLLSPPFAIQIVCVCRVVVLCDVAPIATL